MKLSAEQTTNTNALVLSQTVLVNAAGKSHPYCPSGWQGWAVPSLPPRRTGLPEVKNYDVACSPGRKRSYAKEKKTGKKLLLSYNLQNFM